METKAKSEELKLGFLGWLIRMHEQPCVRRQDYVHMSFCLETLKTQQTEQSFKTRFLAT